MVNLLSGRATPELLSHCPVCQGELCVTRVRCSQCETVIEGKFHLNAFNRLTAEQQRFVEIFLGCRGNMSEVQKELGVSYPTVRARLEEVVERLGRKRDTAEEATFDRVRVLEELASGHIDVDEAIRRLSREKGTVR
jgi:hypothetical protein